MWFLIAMPVQAEQSISVMASFFTLHIDKDEDKTYNEDNNLIGFEYKVDDYYFYISTYDNTYGERSETIGMGYNLYENKYFAFDGLFGFATGYERIVPYIAPRTTFKYDLNKHVTIKTSYQMFGKAFIAMLGFEYKF
jgi:hypothetical protein